MRRTWHDLYGLFWITLTLVISVQAQAAPPPEVALADVYDESLDVSKYWVSEKYDGVRGYWDGDTMRTRAGTVIDLPAWFTAGWPEQALDGELWAGRGHFSIVSAIVRTAGPNDVAWRDVSYQVFDLPEHEGDFTARKIALARLIARIDQPWVRAVEQDRVSDTRTLMARLDRIVARGGEGLILRRADRDYIAGRHAGLIKLKPLEDAEARVVGINPGHGRLAGMMGSIDVRTPGGRTFAIGTGFSDDQRRDPPAIGDWITYGFSGRTATGLPRFARFLHVRPGGPPPEIDGTD